MVFNSVDYLLFFSITALLNCIIPKRFRYMLLCAVSIVFYCISDIRSIPVILGVCAFIYLTCLIESSARNKNIIFFDYPVFMILRVCVLLGVLIGYKYFFKSAFPLGMSFFTLQAIAYVVDVYRKKTDAEKNPLKLTLYIMFFAIVSSGPIERTGNLLRQIREGVNIDISRIKKGLLELAWGLFMKMVLSNRIAPMVNVIYNGYEGFRGIEIVLATILFGIQIYCDFAGYSYMAIGSARILGYDLVDNFDAPYMSINPGEFWRRWHMSLYNWFREYIYFPLGGSRKGTIRKYINVMIVFIVSGMWHGNKLGFIFWGALNGLYVVAQGLISKKTHTSARNLETAQTEEQHKTIAISSLKKVLSVILTFILIDYAWLFFKADSLKQGLSMTKIMLTNPGIGAVGFTELLAEFGVQGLDIIVLVAGILILFVIDFIKNKYKDVTAIVFTRPTVVRWIIYLTLLSVIVIFGIYGYSYEQTEFIYFQF